MKEAAARDRVTLRKFLRSSGSRKSEGKDLKETEMDWVRRRELVRRRKLALISSPFFLFSLLLRVELQYQLLNTVRATVLKLCMTVNIHLGCDAVKAAVNVWSFLLCNLRTIVPAYTASYTNRTLQDFNNLTKSHTYIGLHL